MSYAADCPKKCYYRSHPKSTNHAMVTCDFILIEGHSRGCEGKPYCARYRKRGEERKKEDPDTMLWRGAMDRKPWDHEKGYQLYQQGMTAKQIAAELGISYAAVCGRRARNWTKGKA